MYFDFAEELCSLRADGLSLTTLIKGILTFTEDFFSVDSDNLLSLTISFFLSAH